MKRSDVTTALLASVLTAMLAGCDEAEHATARLWVSNERGNEIAIIDPASWKVVKRVAVGRRPRGIFAAPDGRSLFVALSGSPIGGPGVDESRLPLPDRSADGIAEIDAVAGRLKRIIKVGNDPETFTVNRDGTKLFVSNEDSSQVSIVDVASGVIERSITVGDQPEGIAVSHDGRRVFVACEGSDAVYVIDVEAGAVEAIIRAPGRPRTLLASRDGRSIYLAIENRGILAVIDASSLKIARSIELAKAGGKPLPMGLVERASGTLLLTSGRDSAVLEVDPKQARVVRRIENVGARPWGIWLSPVEDIAYTANGPSGQITEITLQDGKMRHLAAGDSPWGIAGTGVSKEWRQK